MSDIPGDLYFTETHEWVRVEDEGVVRVGITDHAQQLLGDIVFIELPAVDSLLKAGQECAVIESVKAASDVYSPLSGEIIEVNEDLVDSPALINADPYGDAWLFTLQLSDPDELDGLMSADDYEDAISDEDEDA